MKPNFYISKFLLLVVIFSSIFQVELFSQAARIDDWKEPGLFFGGSTSITKTQIINQVGQEITLSNVNYESSFTGSFEIGYFFSRNFGLTSGMNYAPYHSNLYVDTYNNSLSTVDIENDPYELHISGTDIEEIQNFNILSIPLCINIRLPLNKVLGTYLQTGINFYIPLSKSYESAGTFSYQGYFPAYNVMLEDLPDFGFPSNQRIISEGVPELKPLSHGFFMSLGLDYLYNKRIQFISAVSFDRSFSGVLEDLQDEEFFLTTDTEHVYSILGCVNKLTLQSFGLKIGIRYYITDYNKFKYYSRPSVKKNLREYVRQRKRFL